MEWGLALVGLLAVLAALAGWYMTRRTGKVPPPVWRADLALQSAKLGLWDFWPSANRFYISPRIAKQLDLPAHHFHGGIDRFWQQLHPDDRHPCQQQLATAQQKMTQFRLEFRLMTADGKPIWFELAGAAMAGSNPHLVGVIGDVSQRKQSESQLRHETSHDRITGLPTRTLLLERIDHALIQIPHDQPKPPTLLLFNINRFKMVNDQLGHKGGDALLAALAARLTRLCPKTATTARARADHFAMLLPAGIGASPARAEQWLATLTRPLQLDGREIFPDMSIGIAPLRKRHREAGEVLEEAERALIQARTTGQRPAIGLATAHSQREERRRLQLENHLHQALERGEIRLFYQPIMDLHDGHLAGFEALMRWEHPELGAVPPNEFIPVAEETGLIGGLTYSALTAAVQEAAHWQKRYPRSPALFVSVNLSRRELFHAAIVSYLRQALNRAPIRAGSLFLELTETILLHHPEQARRILHALREAGASIAIDDFGAGYSNLAQLSQLPCSLLKLDKSLIANLPKDDNARTIVRAMIGMAHGLDMKIAGEGVDNAAKLAALKQAGCDYAQGFHFAKPMSAAHVRDYLPRLLPRLRA